MKKRKIFKRRRKCLRKICDFCDFFQKLVNLTDIYREIRKYLRKIEQKL